MKKTEIVPTPKTTRYCDHCEAEIGHSYQETTCMVCKKDTCHECAVVMEEWSMDNPPIWCRHCYEIGKPHRAEIKIESDKHEKIIADIHKRWKDAALK